MVSPWERGLPVAGATPRKADYRSAGLLNSKHLDLFRVSANRNDGTPVLGVVQ